MANENNNNFSRNILKLYQNNPDAINIIFEYNLIKGPINQTDHNGNNLLHHIVQKNDVKTLNSVLNYINYLDSFSHGIINHQNKNGDTPMHIAVRHQNEHIAKLLDNAGADLTIKNSNGEVIASSEEKGYNDSDVLSDTVNKWKHLSHQNEGSIDLSDLEDSNFRPFGSRHSKHSRHSRHSNISDTFIGGPGVTDSERFISELARELTKTKKIRIPAVASAYSVATRGMIGGAKNESETSFVVKFTDGEQVGGAQRHRSRSRKSKRSHSPGRTNESSEIHDQVIAKLKEVTGNEEDARAIKAGLYNLVKEQNPTLGNLDRAKKMLEYMNDKKIMKELMNRIPEYRKILAEVRANKEKQGKKVAEASKEKKPKKAKKSSADSESS